MKTLLGWFWRGCLVLVPIVVTIYVGYLVVTTFDRLVPIGLPGLGFVVAMALITFVGFMSSNMIGAAAVTWAERAVTALPFVRLVYTSIRDLLHAFVGDRRGFDRPVLVPLSPGGARVLGFLTRDGIEAIGLGTHVAVYVPQSYNFAGNLLVVPRDQIEPLAVPSTEVIAFIVSGGVSGLGVESVLSERQPRRPTATRTILGMGPRS
ncbi:MAG: DUF502 domain-containing protein [Polyangiaceae bacterium]|nr:DUF502 domain-containing protein [Polyangiaceae bacterium]